MKILWTLFLSSVLAWAVLPGCSGGGGGGSAGNAAQSGVDSTVYAVRSVAPVSVCPSGGIAVDAGIDTNGNGVLDPSEVTSTQYVCNGQTGSVGNNGFTSLITVVSEPVGTNCKSGVRR